jgi:hypothetical protein
MREAVVGYGDVDVFVGVAWARESTTRWPSTKRASASSIRRCPTTRRNYAS